MKKINITINGHKVSRRHPFAYVSISAPVIRKNARLGRNDPPIRVARTQSDPKPVYAREIAINGPAKLIYSADEPIMRCGARLVLVTPYSFVEIKS